MAYGSVLTDVVQSSLTNSPPQFNDTNGTQMGTLCRSWVNFNGVTTTTIRGSFNVSSVTRNGAGDYTVNFTNALTDANYVANVSGNVDAVSNYGYSIAVPYATAPTTSAIRLTISNPAVKVDAAYLYVSIFR
jgi:hypothetical protein